MTFAEYIEQFKRELDLTNSDIAKIMDVGPATFDNYLCGYVRPSQQAMSRLLSILALKEPEGDQSLVLPQDKLPFEALNFDELYPADNGSESFTFTAEDDSLVRRRIYPGAAALIKKCGHPEDGGIFLVSVDEKKARLMVYSEGRAIRLYNDESELVMAQSEFKARVKILGRLTHIETIF